MKFCQYCGLDTDGVDDFYVNGNNHIACEEKIEDGKKPIRIQNIDKIIGKNLLTSNPPVMFKDVKENSRVIRFHFITPLDDTIGMELDRWGRKTKTGDWLWNLEIKLNGKLTIKQISKEQITPDSLTQILEESLIGLQNP